MSVSTSQFLVPIKYVSTHAAEAVVGAVCVSLARTPAGGHCACALGLGEGRGRGALTSIVTTLSSS